MKDISDGGLSSFLIQKSICNFSIDSRDETVTVNECDNDLLPEPLASLFDNDVVNIDPYIIADRNQW